MKILFTAIEYVEIIHHLKSKVKKPVFRDNRKLNVLSRININIYMHYN